MKTIIEFVTLCIALSAFVVSILTFLRQKTFENENHLFKFRLEKYNDVLHSIRETLTFFRKEITNFYCKYSSGVLKDEEMETAVMQFDIFVDKTQIDLVVDYAFLSVEVVNKIEDFLDELYGADFLINVEEKEYNQTIEKLDKLENNLYEIAEAMRNDLGIDKLHRKLLKRIKG